MDDACRGLDWQAGLADAARPEQRDKVLRCKQLQHLADLQFANRQSC
jgi:hypothetical protein